MRVRLCACLQLVELGDKDSLYSWAAKLSKPAAKQWRNAGKLVGRFGGKFFLVTLALPVGIF